MSMTGALVAALVLAAATAFGLIWRRRSGMLRPSVPPTVPRRRVGGAGGHAAVGDGTGHDAAGRDAAGLGAADLGGALGERATLVQFSSAFCAPCRATRAILADVAGTVDGVRHVEIDAESRLELVRRLGIVRTPTVLVLDADGRIAARGSGRPRKADVIAAIGRAIEI
jgi:thiol-disulfide isomerase/thioredoxin